MKNELNEDDILNAADEVCNKPSYFDKKLINQKDIVDLIHKTLNESMINKKIINTVISLFNKIIYEAVILEKTVKIYELEKFYWNNDKNKMNFKASGTLRKLINTEYKNYNIFEIFKIFDSNEELKIIDIAKNVSRFKENLSVFKIKSLKKIKLILVKNIKISFDPKIGIVNRKIIIDLIYRNTNSKYLNKCIITKIIQQFLLVLTEAFMIGIKIKLTNFGIFYPKKSRLKKSIAAYLLFINGKFKTIEFIGRLDIGFKTIKIKNNY